VDGLLAQLRAHQHVTGRGPVALGEDQVHDPQHRRQPLGERFRGRHPEGDARLADLALGPHQPLRHGRLGDQEHRGDLGGGEPAHRAQGEGHAHAEVQRRVAAQEDQRQPVVPRAGRRAGRRRLAHGRLLLPRAPRLPPPPVERLMPRRGGQPGRRVGRDPGGRPLAQRGRARLLHGLLGLLEVAEEPGHGRHRAPPVRAEDRVQLGRGPGGRRVAQLRPPTSITGRTSTDPVVAAGIRRAQRSASSRSAHSSM
jgi:hypothetical protein